MNKFQNLFKDREKILTFSYSRLEDIPYPSNSAELFEAAAKLNYTGIKGDVANTKDGGLIMCHDAEFRYDENGRSYPPETPCDNTRAIDQMTLEECMHVEYELKESYDKLGYYAKATDFETYIKICKKYNKIAYITLRAREIEMVTDTVYNILVKYDMIEQCIVNSFTLETLSAMRKKSDKICLSNVIPLDEYLTREMVDNVIPLGKCVLCAFWRKGGIMSGELYEKSKDAFEYAEANNIQIHVAHEFAEHDFDKDTFKKCLSYGITGFQCINSSVII